MTEIILTEPSEQGSSGMAWLAGEGDSMNADFKHGDPLLVNTNVKSYVGEGIYVFQVGNDRFIKRLQSTPHGFAVLSSNPDYRTWYLKSDMEFKVIGRVVKAWKSQNL